MKKTLAALTIAATTLISPPVASADEVSGCVTDRGIWLFKGTARTICDGVRRPDGSWLRAREFWTPAHYKPLRTNCYGYSYISCTTTGGYWVDRASSGVETYVVFDHNVLPDEPGHIA